MSTPRTTILTDDSGDEIGRIVDDRDPAEISDAEYDNDAFDEDFANEQDRMNETTGAGMVDDFADDREAGAHRRRTDSTGNEIQSYRQALAVLPPLTVGKYAEDAAQTKWIAGCYIGPRHDPNTTVKLRRIADPGDVSFPADLEYEVRITNDQTSITLTVEAAQLLGACLLQAAATATRDLADSFEFLQGN